MTRSIEGRIEPGGPFVQVTLMPTDPHVARVKAAGLTVAPPISVRALIDTGASCCAIDSSIIPRLGLIQTGLTSIHSPTTGGEYEQRDQYDVAIFLGSLPGQVKSFPASVVRTDLATEGFLLIIGWDILRQCVLVCDGPKMKFRLDY